MTSQQHFDPSKSVAHPEVMTAFLRAPLTGELSQVPGIGPVAVEKLQRDNILTSYQLISKFLSFMTEANKVNMDVCESFFHWLTDIGTPPAYRNSIVEAIARRVELVFPGIVYDMGTIVHLEKKHPSKAAGAQEQSQQQSSQGVASSQQPVLSQGK